MTDFMRGAAQDMDVALRGIASLNNALTTTSLEYDFTVSPGPVDPLTDVVYGSASTPVQFDDQRNGYDVTGQQASFETAKLVNYRPGGLLYAAGAVRIPQDPPAGRLTMGLDRITDPATFQKDSGGVFAELDSNGDWAFVIRNQGVETRIPKDGANLGWGPDDPGKQGAVIQDENGNDSAAVWFFDPMDGSGPSGIDLDRTRPAVYLPKIQGTWYGVGPYVLGFEHIGRGGFQRVWPAVAVETRRQVIHDRPSQPLAFMYDDEGAGQSYTFQVFGRQGSRAGEFGGVPNTPSHYSDGGQTFASGEGNAEAIIAFRRAPDSSTTADTAYSMTEIGFGQATLQADQDFRYYYLLDPTITTSNSLDWQALNGANNPDEQPAQFATQDTSATPEDLTVDNTTGKAFGGDIRPGGQLKKVDPQGLDPEEQPFVRNKPIVLMAHSTTGNQGTVQNLLTKFQVAR